MTDQLPEHEIDGLVERLRQRPEVQVAILEERIAKAKAILENRVKELRTDTEAIHLALVALEGK